MGWWVVGGWMDGWMADEREKGRERERGRPCLGGLGAVSFVIDVGNVSAFHAVYL